MFVSYLTLVVGRYDLTPHLWLVYWNTGSWNCSFKYYQWWYRCRFES